MISGLITKIISKLIRKSVNHILLYEYKIFTDDARLHISKSSNVSNAIFNTNSGKITIGENSFCGQNVMFVTGSHDYRLKGEDRKSSIKPADNDIMVGCGVWIGSGSIIIGPCSIGDNAVIGAGSVVTSNIDANSIFAGNPAKLIKHL